MSRPSAALAFAPPLGLALILCSARAQQPSVPAPVPSAPDKHTLVPMQNPAVSPGALELVKLEGDFENAVAKGGGKAFASWFADDGVTLNNGQPAVQGQLAIAARATWDPYEAKGQDAKGQPTTTSGRYITFWKKVHGQWKVALDASANEAPPLMPQP